MPANADDALKAMEAALGTGGAAVKNDPPAGDPPADDPTADDLDPNADPDEGGDPDPDADPAAGDEPEETPEAKAERERLEAEGGDPEETPEAKAERERLEAEAAKKPPDHLNDPIQPGLNKRTTERIQFLANRVRDLEPVAAQGEELIGFINASGMNAEEFGMALTFGKLKHSDNVEDHRKAYAILWQGLKEIAPLIGETLPGVDPLEGHADLKERVTAKTLDPKDAAEIAQGRNRRKADSAAQTRAQQNAQTTAQRTQQNQQLEETVRQELNDLGRSLAANDPQFEAKMELIPQATLTKIKGTPAGLRVSAFLKAFLAVKMPAKAAATAGGAKPRQQPLRAGKVPAAGGGGVKREAKSAVEAMDFALGLK